MNKIPVIGIAAFSGTGKTTLLKSLIPKLSNLGYNVAVIKHAHHDFDIDLPGKDSHELRKSGAKQMLISSRARFVKIAERDQELSLNECLNQLDLSHCDLVLVEGYKREPIKKIELHRAELGQPLLCKFDDNILAVASDVDTKLPENVARIDINDINQVVDYIETNISSFNKLLKG